MNSGDKPFQMLPGGKYDEMDFITHLMGVSGTQMVFILIEKV
jgi:hypothetical protein